MVTMARIEGASTNHGAQRRQSPITSRRRGYHHLSIMSQQRIVEDQQQVSAEGAIAARVRMDEIDGDRALRHRPSPCSAT